MLRPQPIGPVPEETTRIAHAAFPNGHPYFRLADALGTLFTDASFATLFPTHGQPAFAPWRLALVTILQFAEGLADRPSGDAVRSRIDWKYLLRLKLTDPGFDASILSEFRTRLIAGNAETLLFDSLLAWCREQNLLMARGRQRTDSTHVLAAVRVLNRLEVVGEKMRQALNSLAVVAPEWLRQHASPDWVARYDHRAEDDRLPASKAAREALALTIGADCYALLTMISVARAPLWLRQVPAVQTLRQMWVQQYQRVEGAVQWCAGDNIPPASIWLLLIRGQIVWAFSTLLRTDSGFARESPIWISPLSSRSGMGCASCEPMQKATGSHSSPTRQRARHRAPSVISLRARSIAATNVASPIFPAAVAPSPSSSTRAASSAAPQPVRGEPFVNASLLLLPPVRAGAMACAPRSPRLASPSAACPVPVSPATSECPQAARRCCDSCARHPFRSPSSPR